MNARRLPYALGLALALASAGCSGGGDEPTVLPAISSTPTPTPSVPTFPATKQGAADFVRYWIGVLNTVQAGGDQAVYSSTYTADCTACSRFAASMRSYWEEGSVSGGEIQARFIGTALLQDPDAVVTGNVSSAEAQIRNKAGQIVDRQPPVADAILTVSLRWIDSRWRVISYKVDVR